MFNDSSTIHSLAYYSRLLNQENSLEERLIDRLSGIDELTRAQYAEQLDQAQAKISHLIEHLLEEESDNLVWLDQAHIEMFIASYQIILKVFTFLYSHTWPN